MPGLGYGGYGQTMKTYDTYEEYDWSGDPGAFAGEPFALSFRGMPMVVVFAAAFLGVGWYLMFFDRKVGYGERMKERLERDWPGTETGGGDDCDDASDGDGDAAAADSPCDDAPTAILSCMLANTPVARVGGGAVFNDASGDVCLYGGLGERGLLDDEDVYSNEDLEWVAMSKNRDDAEAPGKRAFHAMLYLGSVVLVYGGATERKRTYRGSRQTETYDEGVYVLNLETGEWFKPEVSAPLGAPRARAGTAAAVWKDEAVLFFGGRTSDGFAGDSWLLAFPRPEDPDESAALRWDPVVIDGPSPPGRDGHALVVVDDRAILLGGAGDGGAGALCPPDALEVLDLPSKTWGLVDAPGNGPKASRGLHAHVVGDRGDVAVVDGYGAGVFNDVFVLHTADDRLHWTKLKIDWRSDWTMSRRGVPPAPAPPPPEKKNESPPQDPRHAAVLLLLRQRRRRHHLRLRRRGPERPRQRRPPHPRRRHRRRPRGKPALEALRLAEGLLRSAHSRGAAQ